MHFGLRFKPVIWLCAIVMVALPLHAQNNPQAVDPNLQALKAILENPDDKIDLAKAKLTIDSMIDPSIDIESNLKQLDAMAKQIRAMLPANATSLQKMETLIQYLYKAGPWNGNQPFRYDLDDPFGRKIHNKLLPTYLKTKRGNCISMPLLFIFLGEKIGIDVTVSTAPRHLFVKYRLDDGVFRNFEATSGGPKLDSSYRRDMPMTDQALANGMYMRPLSKKETIAVMAGSLMEFYDKQGQHQRRIILAKLALDYYPQYDGAMLHLVTSYLSLMEREFRDKYRTPADIPMEERTRYAELGKNMDIWRGKVEALGWRKFDEKTEANYMKTIQRTKAAQ